MITEDYVSFEIAKLLKEKGFDEVCFKYALNGEIYNNGDFVISHVDDVEIGIPTLQMATKWLREKYNIFTTVTSGREQGNGNPFYRAWWERLDDIAYRYPVNEQHEYITYEDACEAAIKYCLENLI